MDTPGTNYASVVIKPKRKDSILRKHPWIFMELLRKIEGSTKSGDWVCVKANKGAVMGWGHYSPGTSIAVRMLTFSEEMPTAELWHEKIKQAVTVRRDLGPLSEDNNTCRLVFAEGDGLPGLIADYYAGVLVIQCHTPGMHNVIKTYAVLSKEL